MECNMEETIVQKIRHSLIEKKSGLFSTMFLAEYQTEERSLVTGISIYEFESNTE